MTRFRVLNIEAWRDGGGSWVWNIGSRIKDVEFDLSITNRRLLWLARHRWGLLSSTSSGKVQVERVEGDPYMFEIQDRNTMEPLFAFVEERDDEQPA